MKYKRIVLVLTLMIIFLSVISAVTGVAMNNIEIHADITTVRGEIVQLYSKGLYARDSVSMAAQAIAQDFVTLFVGVPLLLCALFMMKKDNIKGLLLLTGTLGYFMYTYTSYAFIMFYNSFFLIYVALMALSFYAFVLCILSLQDDGLKHIFTNEFPRKSLVTLLLFMGLMLCMMWLGRIIPTIFSDVAPYGLEHYSTLGIQTLDLGVIVPACFVSARLLWRRQPFGYLLSVVLVLKMITMLTAVSAMVASMHLNGIDVSVIEMIVFPMFNLLSIIFMLKILKETKQQAVF